MNSEERMIARLSVIGLVLIVLLIFLFGSFYIVSAGQRAVILTWGNPSELAVAEGLHFKVPIMQSAIKMDVKTQKYEADASAASKDLQVVSTKIAVNYRLNPESTPKIYQNIGLDYENRIIQPAVQEVVKATTALFTAEELITRRPEVKEKVLELLRERLVERGIIVEEISMTDFDFSDAFNVAIENKVTAEQNALAAKNKLEQVKYEAEQAVTAARGQAEAQALLSTAVNRDTLEYQQLLNEKAAIDKWNGELPTYTGGAVPFISLEKSTSEN